MLGVDVTTVSKMAGHANVLTTAKYDRRDDDAKRKAAKALHVPHPGRPRDLSPGLDTVKTHGRSEENLAAAHHARRLSGSNSFPENLKRPRPCFPFFRNR
jgi:hypothetical protein